MKSPLAIFLFGVFASALFADESPSLKPALIRGAGPGWRTMAGEDFVNVNCDKDTWAWKDGHAFCTGKPVGVIRTKKPLKNLELVCEWMHKKKGGNSGVFLWASQASIDNLAKGNGRLPHGIEVQVLDLGLCRTLLGRRQESKSGLVHFAR